MSKIKMFYSIWNLKTVHRLPRLAGNVFLKYTYRYTVVWKYSLEKIDYQTHVSIYTNTNIMKVKDISSPVLLKLRKKLSNT